MAPSQINVLIVNDSAADHPACASIVKTVPGCTLFGTASDPFEAPEVRHVGLPDVVLRHRELPRMDGLCFLRRIMAQRPLPVVFCSSHSKASSASAMRALDLDTAQVPSKTCLDPPDAPAKAGGDTAPGIILTGPGDDGAVCMAERRATGARTLAQNAATCVVLGMPREAVAAGSIDRVPPRGQFTREIAAHRIPTRPAGQVTR